MIFLAVNCELVRFDAPNDRRLLWVLREVLDLTGMKFGSAIAQCGEW
jgi:aerobic-type carbon monoxide dehydrogenase small subunit (CoxS/CutS family)